jgi:hypothetical protein
MLKEIPPDMQGTSKTPASSYLFITNPESKRLDKEQEQLFHHLVANLLYLSRHTRQDIQKAVTFLCTRVKDPDIDDYKKLTRLM